MLDQLLVFFSQDALLLNEFPLFLFKLEVFVSQLIQLLVELHIWVLGTASWLGSNACVCGSRRLSSDWVPATIVRHLERCLGVLLLGKITLGS